MMQRPAAARWLLLPMLAWLGLFIVLPCGILLFYSLCRRGEYGQVEFTLTLQNYRDAMDASYLRTLVRSLLYASITTLACILIGYPVAYFVGRSSPRVRDWLMLLIMLPFWTSFVIRTYAWITILSEQGFLNGLLQSMNLITSPLSLLYTPGTVILGLVYTYLPFMILPIYTAVEHLDNNLLEAAADLGAGPMHTFGRVTLPLTLNGIAAGTVLTFIPAIGMFAVSSLLGGNRAQMIGDVIESKVIGSGRNLPLGAALSVILLALFMLVALLIGRRGAIR